MTKEWNLLWGKYTVTNGEIQLIKWLIDLIIIVVTFWQIIFIFGENFMWATLIWLICESYLI